VTLAPLLTASPVIQLHVAAAVSAFGLGAVQLVLPKGTTGHRIRGYVWTVFMAVLAVSSFWIHTIRQFGSFSLIHLLSVLTLIGLPRAIYLARKGDITGHRRAMGMLFLFALVGAGAFTLLPGRLVHEVFFG
jgi:uncharacterized membrane protein